MSSTWIVGAAGYAFGVESGEETAGSTGAEGSGEDDGHLTAAEVTVVDGDGCWKRSAERNDHMGIAGNVLFLVVEVPLAPVVLVAASAHKRR